MKNEKRLLTKDNRGGILVELHPELLTDLLHTEHRYAKCNARDDSCKHESCAKCIKWRDGEASEMTPEDLVLLIASMLATGKKKAGKKEFKNILMAVALVSGFYALFPDKFEEFVFQNQDAWFGE